MVLSFYGRFDASTQISSDPIFSIRKLVPNLFVYTLKAVEVKKTPA